MIYVLSGKVHLLLEAIFLWIRGTGLHIQRCNYRFQYVGYIKQRPGEFLDDYLKRFNTEVLKVENVTDNEKLIAVGLGWIEQTHFWKELYIRGCWDLQHFYLQTKKSFKWTKCTMSWRNLNKTKKRGRVQLQNPSKKPKGNKSRRGS